MDTRARYGAALGEKIGTWSEKVFNFFTAASCLVLGVIASIELVLGALEVPVVPYIVVIYALFLLFWTYTSLIFATPHDEARSVDSFFGGLVMGVFGGIFTATPAFVILLGAQNKPGSSLEAYMKCEPVALWQKAVSVLP